MKGVVLAAILAVAATFSGASVEAAPIQVQPETRLQAEPTLETQIAAVTGIVRTVDSGLRSKAAARVVEIQTDFSHVGAGLAYGQAEVIGWNRGYAEPLAAVIAGWLASPSHAHILLDPYYTKIGCAWATTPATDTLRATTWLVCWFQAADKPAPIVHPPTVPPIKPVVVVVLPPYVGTIPDTAMSR